jgi:nitrite reductase (NADH) small subunit
MALLDVCGIDDVPSAQTLCKRLADGTQVSVTRIGDAGRILAFENRCPHVNGPIGLGKLTGTTIVCPWHFFRFDIETGAAVGFDSVMHLRVFKAVVEGGRVFIET